MKAECPLWDSARNVAESKGVYMTPKCPMQEVCTGNCVFVDPEVKVKTLLVQIRDQVNEGLQKTA